MEFLKILGYNILFVSICFLIAGALAGSMLLCLKFLGFVGTIITSTLLIILGVSIFQYYIERP